MKKFKTYAILFMALVIALLILVLKVSNSRLKVAELKLKKTDQSFSEYKDKQGKKYIQQEQIIATQKEAIKAGLIEKQELKDKDIKQAKTIVRLQNQVKITNKEAVYITKVDTVFLNDTQSFLRVPIAFSFQDEFLFIKGRVLLSGVMHDSISLVDSSKLIVGSKRVGLFKNLDVVTYENSNPYISTTGMHNVIIDDTKWYNSLFFKGVCSGVSAGLGFYLGYKLAK